jgi:hypothetical protein
MNIFYHTGLQIKTNVKKAHTIAKLKKIVTTLLEVTTVSVLRGTLEMEKRNEGANHMQV